MDLKGEGNKTWRCYSENRSASLKEYEILRVIKETSSRELQVASVLARHAGNTTEMSRSIEMAARIIMLKGVDLCNERPPKI